MSDAQPVTDAAVALGELTLDQVTQTEAPVETPRPRMRRSSSSGAASAELFDNVMTLKDVQDLAFAKNTQGQIFLLKLLTYVFWGIGSNVTGATLPSGLKVPQNAPAGLVWTVRGVRLVLEKPKEKPSKEETKAEPVYKPGDIIEAKLNPKLNSKHTRDQRLVLVGPYTDETHTEPVFEVQSLDKLSLSETKLLHTFDNLSIRRSKEYPADATVIVHPEHKDEWEFQRATTRTDRKCFVHLDAKTVQLLPRNGFPLGVVGDKSFSDKDLDKLVPMMYLTTWSADNIIYHRIKKLLVQQAMQPDDLALFVFRGDVVQGRTPDVAQDLLPFLDVLVRQGEIAFVTQLGAYVKIIR